MDNFSIYQLKYLARLNALTDRHESNLSLFPAILQAEPLTVDTVRLIKVTYRKLVDKRQTVLEKLRLVKKDKLYSNKGETIEEIVKEIKQQQLDIKKFILEAIDFLEKQVVSASFEIEHKVIFLTLIADLYRIMEKETDEKYTKEAMTFYYEAYELSYQHLEVINCAALGLAINYTKYLFSGEKKEKAVSIVSEVFEKLKKYNLSEQEKEVRDQVGVLMENGKTMLTEIKKEKLLEG